MAIKQFTTPDAWFAQWHNPMKSSRDHVKYCLLAVFKENAFYAVDFPQIVDTTYVQHYQVLTWLREVDRCQGKYISSPNDGVVFFAEYETALQFMLTWGSVKLKNA